ncbi:hypothetical protein AN401_08735 [Zobellella denitrificans]|uniref:Uncharacterized protein n=1 Tax=Zobellella denitrificans TaxID=347534 RepID=A0A291HP34_9GAMM|nr:hypothetical protein AN401_08735 [Zobellella denitrificans]
MVSGWLLRMCGGLLMPQTGLLFVLQWVAFKFAATIRLSVVIMLFLRPWKSSVLILGRSF